MTISNLPPPPNRSTQDRAEFVLTADAFLAALPTFVTQVNDTASDMDTAAALVTAAAIDVANDADRAEAAADYRVSVAYKTYSQLAATSAAAGTTAAVFGPDAGTHTDPVVGGTVNNLGVYRYSTSPAGWERLTNLPASGVATPGSVVFAGASGSYSEDNANLFWDDTNNRLGIGTASPAYSLTVQRSALAGNGVVANLNNPYGYGTGVGTAAATLQFTRDPSTGGAAGVMAEIFGGNEAEDTSTSGYMAFGTRSGAPNSTSERVRITSAGNVGIGTSSPVQPLHVRRDNTGTVGVLVQNRSATGSPSAALQFISGSFDLADNRYAMISSSGGASTTLQFWTGNGATPAERMRIDASGNVGIGTSSPRGRLTVGTGAAGGNPTYSGDIVVRSGMANTTSQGGLEFQSTTFSNGYGFRLSTPDFGGGSTPLVIESRVDSAAWTERMRIDASGNVGIGTGSPGYALDVAAADATAGLGYGMRLRANATANAGAFQFTDAAVTAQWGYIAVSTSEFRLAAEGRPLTLWSGSSERARITSGGCLGVGSDGSDFARSWRFIAKHNQNAQSEFGFVNGDAGASAAVCVARIGGVGNSFCNWILANNSGSPVDSYDYGSAVTAVRWRFNGTQRFQISSTGAIASADRADAVGYKGLPQNPKTASYTLTLSDMGKDIYLSGTTSGQSITIPANGSVAFPVGTVIQITNDSNQNWSIPITTDTLVLSPGGSTGTRTLAAFGQCTIRKVSATRWWISGVGLT